jgi:hypothetical protein
MPDWAFLLAIVVAVLSIEVWLKRIVRVLERVYGELDRISSSVANLEAVVAPERRVLRVIEREEQLEIEAFLRDDSNSGARNQ